MIRHVYLKSRSLRTNNAVDFTPGTVTVVVGPNGAGKSLMLREIEQHCSRNHNDAMLILDRLECQWPSPTEAIAHLKELGGGDEFVNPQGNKCVPVLTIGRKFRLEHREEDVDMVRRLFEQETERFVDSHASYYLRYLTIRLDGHARLGLTDPQECGDIIGRATNVLMRLFQDDANRKLLQSITNEAFGLYFVIDTLMTHHMRARMATRPPTDDEEQTWRECARIYFKECVEITACSDGIRAFSGLLAGVIALPHKIILIDEPEAFLHPPLARFLGQKLVEIAAKRNASLFVSTHSADFLMGCVQGGVPLSILRLAFERGEGTASCIAADKVREMMYDPLLRSTGVLASLFHKSAVVCEGDTDRAFYSEVSERMLRAKRAGARDTAFINAQNKQTIPRIVKPLREIGIPAAAIVDVDIIKNGGQEWTRLLRAGGIPVSLHSTLAQLRTKVKTAFDQTGKCMKRDGGIALLSDNEQAALRHLVGTFADYGIFVVEHGEVEAWLRQLDSTGHGPEWLVKVFERMGTDPTASNYLAPGEGDVWAFVERLASWLQDTNRAGMRDIDSTTADGDSVQA